MTTEVIVKVPDSLREGLSVLVHTQNGSVVVDKGEQRSFYVYPGHTVLVEELDLSNE